MFEQLFELGSAAGDDSFKEAFQQDTLAVEGLLPDETAAAVEQLRIDPFCISDSSLSRIKTLFRYHFLPTCPLVVKTKRAHDKKETM